MPSRVAAGALTALQQQHLPAPAALLSKHSPLRRGWNQEQEERGIVSRLGSYLRARTSCGRGACTEMQACMGWGRPAYLVAAQARVDVVTALRLQQRAAPADHSLTYSINRTPSHSRIECKHLAKVGVGQHETKVRGLTRAVAA